MSQMKKMMILVATIVAIMFLPYFSGWMYNDGIFPEHYFQYPPLTAPEKAPFTLYVAIALLVFNIVWVIIYLFPKIKIIEPL